MNENLLKRKKELEQEKRIAIQRIYDLQERSRQIDIDVAEVDRQIDLRVLVITDHAYERFKERVLDIPEKRIKPILTSKGLLEDYKKYGEGEYPLEELPHVNVIIKDFAIITVINTMNIEERFLVLDKYMDYYIQSKIDLAKGDTFKIMSCGRFRKLYWKSRSKKAA